MKRIAVINSSLCDKSPFCPVKKACPVKAVTSEKKGIFGLGSNLTVDKTRCTGCGICVKFCPRNAVTLENIES